MKVLITGKVLEDSLKLFDVAGISYERWDEDQNGKITKEDIIREGKKYDALITQLSEKIDAEVLIELKHLKIVANYAVGFNNIDVAKAKELGIVVTNTPDVLTEGTAEGTVALILATVRNFRRAQHLIDQGEWKAFTSMFVLGTELKGKTLGMVGLGRIGARVAEICHFGFGMDVVYHTRSGSSERAHSAFKPVSFDELLKVSDIVTALCPLNDGSRNLFNKETFLKMKRSAYFINAARGEVHNETDLFHALRDGVIQGAGLDVFNPEPMKMDSPLFTLKNIYMTPHIASSTVEARNAMTELCVRNVIAVIKGEALASPQVTV